MKVFVFLICFFHLPYLIVLLFLGDFFSYQSADIWYSIFLVAVFAMSSLVAAYFLKLNEVQFKNNRINMKCNDGDIYLALSLFVFVVMIMSNFYKSYILFTSGYLGTYVENEFVLNSATFLPFYIYFSFRFFIILNFKIRTSILSNTSRVIFILSIFSFLLTGSRSLIVYYCLTVYYYLTLTRLDLKIITFKSVLIFASMVFAIGVMREGSSEFSFESLMIRPIIETHHTAKTLIDVVSYPDLIDGSLFRYIQSLAYLFPASLMNLIGVELPKLLAAVYVDKIDPGWAAVGGGFGFSILSELYISFGALGFFLFPVFVGFLFVKINKYIQVMEINAAAYSLSLCYYVFSLARGEIVDAYRGVFVISLLYFLNCVRIFKKSPSS